MENYKKNDNVVYPKHGAGKIVGVYKQRIGDTLVDYYKIAFLNSPTTVSIPINKALELGLRRPMSRRALKEALKKLDLKVNINRKTLITLDAVSKTKLTSGKTEDAIDLVNLLRSLAKQKEEENKNFSYSYSDRLEIALEFIASEVEVVLGKSAPKHYNLNT